MPKIFRAAFFGLCALAVSATAAKADIQAIRSSDNEFWGSIGSSFLNYKEPANAPNLPDSEHGWLPALALGVSTLGAEDKLGMFGSNLYLALEASGAFGNADYNGTYFAAPTVPLRGTTSESIFDVDGKVGKGFVYSDSIMLIPYLELGYHYWDRNLGGGQVEDYQHFAILAGAMGQWAPTSNIVLSAHLAAGTTLSPKMTASSTTYELQDNGIYKMGVKAGYNITKQTEIFTTLDYDHFSYGHSGVIAGAYEPDSDTNNTTIRVGLGFHFQ